MRYQPNCTNQLSMQSLTALDVMLQSLREVKHENKGPAIKNKVRM